MKEIFSEQNYLPNFRNKADGLNLLASLPDSLLRPHSSTHSIEECWTNSPTETKE